MVPVILILQYSFGAKWVWVDKGVGKERRWKVRISWSGDHPVAEGAELAAFVDG